MTADITRLWSPLCSRAYLDRGLNHAWALGYIRDGKATDRARGLR